MWVVRLSIRFSAKTPATKKTRIAVVSFVCVLMINIARVKL